MKICKLAVVVVALVALQTAAFGVISLVYEVDGPPGSGIVAGMSPAIGTRLTFKIENWDVGTIYPMPVVPDPVGYTGLPGNAVGIGNGVAAVNVAQAIACPGAQARGLYANMLEDTWGIGKITGIIGEWNVPVWTPQTKGHELNVLFYGEQDIFVESMDPTDPLSNSRIDGINLRVDIYHSSLILNPLLGVPGRTAANTYPTVNAEGQVLELSMISLPGFINAPGTGAGLATEFESRFNFGSFTGDGEAWVEITGGASQCLFDGDCWGVADSWAMNPAHVPLMPVGSDLDSDVSLAFDTFPAPAPPPGWDPNDDWWLVTSEDPMLVELIPEPLTMLGLFMGLGGVGAYIRKRRMV